MILRWGNLGENPGNSAFRVRATLGGRKFTLSPVAVIQKGPEEMFEATGEIKDFSFSTMFLEIPSQSCSIRFSAGRTCETSGSVVLRSFGGCSVCASVPSIIPLSECRRTWCHE